MHVTIMIKSKAIKMVIYYNVDFHFKSNQKESIYSSVSVSYSALVLVPFLLKIRMCELTRRLPILSEFEVRLTQHTAKSGLFIVL